MKTNKADIVKGSCVNDSGEKFPSNSSILYQCLSPNILGFSFILQLYMGHFGRRQLYVHA